MEIDIKKSQKRINYNDAIEYLEKRVNLLNENKANELIWTLEHESIYTAGKRYKKNEIIDKNIILTPTSRGGKITWHGPGQLICYFVLDLKKREKDIRKFIKLIENTIIISLKKYKIKSFSDRKNIGIWVNHKSKDKKIAAIGIKVKKWIAYHGFSININNDLAHYKKIIPCGIKDKKVINLKLVKNLNYKNLKNEIVNNLIKNLEKKVF